jgi:hypothetical protein
MATFAETGLVLKANSAAPRKLVQLSQELASFHDTILAQICAKNRGARLAV